MAALAFYDYRSGSTRPGTATFEQAILALLPPYRVMLLAWLRGGGQVALQSSLPIRAMMDYWTLLEKSRTATNLKADAANLITKAPWYAAVLSVLTQYPSEEGALLQDLLRSFQPPLEAAQNLDQFESNLAKTSELANVGIRGVVQVGPTTSALSLANSITAIGV